MPDWRRSPLTAAVCWLTAFTLTIVGVVTLIGNKVRAAGNDAVFTQGLVDRAQRFGGTYYQNGITPKGPLEDVVHDIARRLGGYDGHFYVISIAGRDQRGADRRRGRAHRAGRPAATATSRSRSGRSCSCTSRSPTPRTRACSTAGTFS